jgi:aldose 1-epimerase
MYQLKTEAFGSFTRCTIAHDTFAHRIAFVPERGGCLLSAVLQGTEVLDGYQTPEEVDFNRWGKSGVLYPFPNRLKDGRYQWEGKTYQFPINDRDTGNALHGFGMDRPLEVVQVDLDADEAYVELEGAYDGSLDYYPWAFTFRLSYRLLLPDQLWVELSLRNDSTATIPVGLGWHPYFQLDDTLAKQHLQLPAMDMVGIDARMIPTGKRYPYDEFLQPKAIEATVLDNCFALPTGAVQATAYLYGHQQQLRYWQETGLGKFNFLQVFTPPYRRSVALEPMTCNVDAFNNGEGLAAVAPGEEVRAKAGMQLTR